MKPEQNIFLSPFTYQGRMNRKPFFLNNLALGIIVTITLLFVILYYESHSQENKAPLGLLFIVFISDFILRISLVIRRCHDINWSGWFYLLSFLPLIGPFFGLFLFFKKGTLGPNRFGPDPLSDYN